jgi:hypothetical protein
MIRIGPLQIAHDGTHIPSDGSHIADGAPDPSTFFVRHGSPSSESEMVVYIEGKKWAACEVFIFTEVPKAPKNLRFEFVIKTDGGIVDLNVFEHDLKVTIAGRTYNLSAQTVLTRNGMIQTSDPTQGWNDAAIEVTPLTPFYQYRYVIDYTIDTVAQTCSYESIEVEGQVWQFGGTQKNLPSSTEGWADSVVVQFQWGLRDFGDRSGAVGMAIDEVYVTWI